MFKSRSSTRNRRCSGQSSEMRVFMRVKSASGRFRVLLFAQHAEHQQQSTHDDRAIGDIEGRPVVNADIEIKKVGHLAIRETVPKISERATHNQREGYCGGVEDLAAHPEQKSNHGQSSYGDGNKQPCLER